MIATTVFATACGSPVKSNPPPRANLHAVPVSATQQQALASADDAFARELWSTLATSGDNVVLSPASIATALQMAYVGARGDTAAEMARVLHLGTDAGPMDVAAAASRLLDRLAPLGHDKHALVTLADEVWLQRNFPVLQSFTSAMSTGFGSAFHAADFAGHGEDARRAIDKAIEAKTHGRIRDLFPPGYDLSDARLVLTNAVYLKAEWAKPFDTHSTAPAPFTRGDGSVVHPQTMQTYDGFDYAATDGYQEVRLPYAGDRLTMTLLLPAPGRPLSWPAVAPRFREHTVDLALPKFRFDWDESLKPILAGLGMPAAFSDRADFSGMARASLQIGDVRHKAFIAVDENGTEAAAATALTMVATGARAPIALVHLHLDRPFLFRIDDTAAGLPLFLGKVADPTLGG